MGNYIHSPWIVHSTPLEEKWSDDDIPEPNEVTSKISTGLKSPPLPSFIIRSPTMIDASSLETELLEKHILLDTLNEPQVTTTIHTICQKPLHEESS
jgi:hypothetical protein